jgi:hypothetical protein
VIRRDPKKMPTVATAGVAPPGLEPGLSWILPSLTRSSVGVCLNPFHETPLGLPD